MKQTSSLSSKKYHSFTEICYVCNVKKYTLRYWQKEIKDLNPIQVNNKNYYTVNQIVLVNKINKLIYKDGYSLEGVKNILSKKNIKKDIYENLKDIDSLKIEISNLIKYIKTA
jgi:DNA-binding transcriptional MerR regulator